MAEQAPQEPKITINGKDYLIKDLSDDAKAQLTSLQFTESEIRRLEALLAVARTAQTAYQRALVAALPPDS